MLHIYAYLVNMDSYCINFMYIHRYFIQVHHPLWALEASQISYVFSRFKKTPNKQTKKTTPNQQDLDYFFKAQSTEW